jgi:hypothetical protein
MISFDMKYSITKIIYTYAIGKSKKVSNECGAAFWDDSVEG